MDSSCFLI
jgi:exonuclease III